MMNLSKGELLIVACSIFSFVLLIWCILSIIRDKNMSKSSKFIWIVFLIFVPVIPSLLYLFLYFRDR